MAKKLSHFCKKMKSNPWIVSTVVLLVIVLVLMFVPGVTSKAVSADSAGRGFVDFINSRGGSQIEYVGSEKFSSDLYQVTVLADGSQVPAYITKDGKYFVQVVAEITDEEPTPSQTNTQTEEAPIVKAEVPEVELFVMSYCPYGTQAMKGIIPAIRAFGDSIDFKLRFVNYAMHGEKEVRENVEMYCIQEEQSDKLLDYLECYLGGTSGSDSEIAACRAKAQIDEDMLNTCITSANEEFDIEASLADTSSRYPKFLIDNDLNLQYGVQGSPTLVVNGAQVSSARNSQAYGDVICQAFSETPELCGEINLSTANPSPGFGYSTTTSASTAECA